MHFQTPSCLIGKSRHKQKTSQTNTSSLGSLLLLRLVVQTAHWNLPKQLRWWTVAIQTHPGKHQEQPVTSVLGVTAPEDNSSWQREEDAATPSAQVILGATLHRHEGPRQLVKFGNRYFPKLWAFCFWAEQVFLAVKKMDSVYETSMTSPWERGMEGNPLGW